MTGTTTPQTHGSAKTLAIDIETRSSVDLGKLGVYKYAEADGFRVLLLAYKFDDEPVEIVDIARGEEPPLRLLAGLTDSTITKTAFNASFERVCLDRWFKTTTGPWECTMIKAWTFGITGGLALVGHRVGLPTDQEKLKVGKELIKLFCAGKPVAPEERPLEWETFRDYCKQDVVAEAAIREKLERFTIPPQEQRLWEIDQKINDRGVRIDADFVVAALRIKDTMEDRLKDRFEELTGFRDATRRAEVIKWIEQVTGIKVTSLTKTALPELRETLADYPEVLEAIDIRFQLSRTSLAKYQVMLDTMGDDGRSRGNIQFFGAITGRFAGRLIQVHNLPQNHLKNLPLAREVVATGGADFLEMMFSDPTDILRQCIRTAIIPAEGKKFVVADFSAIEARVLAWLAGEDWRLGVFMGNGKIYEASAAKMFGVPASSIKKGDPLRQKGKVAELALGYAGSAGALKAMGALDMGLSEEELPGLVAQWREANPAIISFWYRVQWACERAIRRRQPVEINTWLKVDYIHQMLRVHLPSGRAIHYPKAMIRPHNKFEGKEEIAYEASKGAAVFMQGTYYGKLTENIVQAVARDCLAHILLELDRAGYETVFHVHDEVIVEVSEDDDQALPAIIAMMGKAPPWAPGLPLRGDGYECSFYQKD